MFVDFAEHHGPRSPIRLPPSSSSPHPTQKKKKKELSEEDEKKRKRERMRRRKDRYNEKEVRLYTAQADVYSRHGSGYTFFITSHTGTCPVEG